MKYWHTLSKDEKVALSQHYALIFCSQRTVSYLIFGVCHYFTGWQAPCWYFSRLLKLITPTHFHFYEKKGWRFFFLLGFHWLLLLHILFDRENVLWLLYRRNNTLIYSIFTRCVIYIWSAVSQQTPDEMGCGVVDWVKWSQGPRCLLFWLHCFLGPHASNTTGSTMSAKARWPTSSQDRCQTKLVIVLQKSSNLCLQTVWRHFGAGGRDAVVTEENHDEGSWWK